MKRRAWPPCTCCGRSCPGSWKPGTNGLPGPCESVSLELAESGAAVGVTLLMPGKVARDEPRR
jgi:hypothetical protein